MTELDVDFFRSLEEALHRPDVRRSRDDLDALLAECLVEIGQSGRLYDRETIINSLLAEPGDGPNGTITSTDFAARLISTDVVLLTYRTQRTLPNDETRQTLRSSIWRLNDGKWQMLFHQGTPAS